jgi:ectoine hydroxylase-related dioxygenase (phytanoyl-CoA dioxygenase family)
MRPLPEDAAARFRADGYLMLERLFSRADLDAATAAIAAIVAQGEGLEYEPEAVDGERRPRRIYDPFHRHDAFRRLATDPRLLDRVAELLGGDIALHHSKLNMKLPRVGSPVEWHQDLAYFPHTNPDLLAALVHLDDADLDNGCLQVRPGHHHVFLDHRRPDGAFAGMITEALDDARHGAALALPAPAGSVVLLHCMLPHASLPNRSERPRRVLIFQFRAADAAALMFDEPMVAQLRGKPLTAARFAGPPPPIPRWEQRGSLFAVQAAAKERR